MANKTTTNKKERARVAIEKGLDPNERTEAKIKERRLQRKSEAKKGKLAGMFGKLADKYESNRREYDADAGWLLENTPYYTTPSYIRHNGRVASIVELYNRPGANRQMTYAQIIDTIPVDALDGVEMYMVVNDALIKDDEKKRLIRQNAKGGKDTINDAIDNGPKEDGENKSTQAANFADLEDYDEYEMILDAADPVVYYRIQLVVIGPDMSTVEEQIDILNTLLDQRHEGARWDSLGGDQHARFTKLLDSLPKDRFSMTSTAENYSGINFAISAGLNDSKGLPIGKDAQSLTSTSAFFDMDGTLRRQGIIAIPRSSVMRLYEQEDAHVQVSTASLFAQYAANHASFNNHKTYHLVMNDFDYLKRGLFYRPMNIPGVFAKYDVARMTINPLQGFGELEDVVQVFSRLTQKIVNIFDVLTDLTMDKNEKSTVLNVIERFYTRQQLWTDDAELYPRRTRIVNIPNPKNYPTTGMLLNDFTTLADEAIRQGREAKMDRVESLESLLKQSITTNRGILGRPTSIDERDALHTYYDFSSIESSQIVQVQFLNLIDYVIWRAKPGDIIALHGVDKIWTPVLDMVSENIEAAQNKGVRFIFAYDTISTSASARIKRADMFDMKGRYYTDLDTDVDWTVIGKCLPNEVDAFETALATSLSDMIRFNMMRKARCQALIHRSVGDVNNFVHLNLVV